MPQTTARIPQVKKMFLHQGNEGLKKVECAFPVSRYLIFNNLSKAITFYIVKKLCQKPVDYRYFFDRKNCIDLCEFNSGRK